MKRLTEKKTPKSKNKTKQNTKSIENEKINAKADTKAKSKSKPTTKAKTTAKSGSKSNVKANAISRTNVKVNRRVFPKIFILLILILVIASIVFLSGLFNIKKIEVAITSENSQDKSENLKLQSAEIESLSGLTIGQNMFEKSKQEITTAIMKNPYVKSVNIKRKLNGNLVISIVEREPKYLINYAGSYIYIDRQGYILEVNSESLQLPILLGITTDFTSLANNSEKKVDRLNNEDLDKLSVVNNIMDISKNNDIEGIISRIDITDDRDYIVYLDSENKTVYLGDCSDLNTRILYMKAIVKQESGNKGEIFINENLDTSYVYFRAGV